MAEGGLWVPDRAPVGGRGFGWAGEALSWCLLGLCPHSAGQEAPLAGHSRDPVHLVLFRHGAQHALRTHAVLV